MRLGEMYEGANEHKNLGRGNFEYAIKLYDKLLSNNKIKNTVFAAHCLNEKACCLAGSDYGKGREAEIISMFKSVVKIAPENPLFHKNYILALSKSGPENKSKAVAHIEKWSKHFENDIVFNYNIALIFGDCHNNDNKKDYYINRCKRNLPTEDKRYMALIYASIADYYIKKSKVIWRDTIEEYNNKAIAMDKTNMVPYLQNAFISSGRDSVNHLIAGLRNNKDNFEGLYMLHAYLCKIRKYGFSHNVAALIHKKYPDFKIIHFCMAVTNYFRLRDHRQKNPHPNFYLEQELKQNINENAEKFKAAYNLI